MYKDIIEALKMINNQKSALELTKKLMNKQTILTLIKERIEIRAYYNTVSKYQKNNYKEVEDYLENIDKEIIELMKKENHNKKLVGD